MRLRCPVSLMFRVSSLLTLLGLNFGFRASSVLQNGVGVSLPLGNRDQPWTCRLVVLRVSTPPRPCHLPRLLMSLVVCLSKSCRPLVLRYSPIRCLLRFRWQVLLWRRLLLPTLLRWRLPTSKPSSMMMLPLTRPCGIHGRCVHLCCPLLARALFLPPGF